MTKTARGRLISLVSRLQGHREIIPWLLEGEDCAQVENPTTARIRLQLSRLRAKGPSFVSLAAPDGSYMQAAGSGQRLAVEFHRVDRNKTNHFVIGRFDDDGGDAFVHASFGRLDVHRSEVMTVAEVGEILDYFLHFRKVPPHYQLRDITAEVAAAAA